MTTSVNQVPPGRVQFFDANGNPLVNGKVYFYIPSTLTPKTTYSDSNGSSSNTNPITLDTLGWAAIWGTGQYRQIVKDSLGNTLWDAVTSTNQVGQGYLLDNIAALQAATVPSSVNAVQLSGYTSAGDGGAALYKKSGSAGPGAGLVQSADGQWWVLASNPVNVCQFGADTTGSASSVTAFNTAISWANARSTSTSGVEIDILCGKYKIDSSLSAVTASNVSFRGTRSSVLAVSATGSVFTWNSGATYGGIFGGLTIEYPSNPASTATVLTVSNAGNLQFEAFAISNINTLAVLGTDVSHVAHSIVFKDCMGSVFNSGQPTFAVKYGADLVLDNVNVFVTGVAVPTFNRTSTMTTVANTNFIDITNGGWDDIHCTGGTTSNRYWRAVNISVAGASVTNLWFNDCVFDFNSDDAMAFSTPNNGSSTLANVFVHNTYIASWSGNGISVTGSGLGISELLDFSGTHVYIAGKHGVYLNGPNTSHIKMNNMEINQVNRLSGGTDAGIRVDTIGGYWEAIGTHVQSDPEFGGAWPGAYYGIDIAANNFVWTVTDCNMAGTNTNYNVTLDATFTSFVTQRLMCNNINANYQGLQTLAPFVLPATTVSWQNNTPWNVLVCLSGMTDIGIDQTGDLNTTSAQFVIPPGHTFDPIYSGSPRSVWLVQP